MRNRRIDAVSSDGFVAAHARGKAILARLAKALTAPSQHAIKRQKEPTMTTINAIVKGCSPSFILKAVNAANDAFSLTEHEMTAVLTKLAAAHRREGESAAQAFSRCFQAQDEQGAMMRKAISLAKGMVTLEPVGIGGDDFDVNEPEEALKQLNELAAKQRRAGETFAQSFARQYTDPANARLAAAERRQNRPSA